MPKRKTKYVSTQSAKKDKTNSSITKNHTRIYFQKNHLIIISIILPIIMSFAIYYLGYAEPDIRISFVQPMDVLKTVEEKLDDNANYLVYLSVRPKFKNVSFFKSGFIDRVEIAPLSLKTVPDAKIMSIEKVAIGCREEAQIEFKILLTVPIDVMRYLNSEQKISIEILLNAYDNTGKLINRSTNDLFARLQFDWNKTAEIKLNK